MTSVRPLLGLALGVVLLASCDGGAAAPPSQLIKITLANPSAAAPGAIQQVTKDAGIFAQNGLDVDLQVVNGAPQLLAALLSGQIPITMQGSPAVFQAALGGADIVMVSGVVNTTFFTIFGRSDITSVEQLRGKKIGSMTGGGNDEATVNLVLQRFNMSPKDVQIINIPQPARLQALQNGAVDAIVITNPYTIQARKLGMHEVIDVSALKLEYQSSTFVTSRSYLRDHRDVVTRFLRALSQGIKFYKTHKDESMRSIGVFTQQTDPDVLEETYNDFALKYTSKVPYLSIPGLKYVLESSIQDPKAKEHTVDDFIDQSIIQQLDKEGLYKQLWGNDTQGV